MKIIFFLLALCLTFIQARPVYSQTAVSSEVVKTRVGQPVDGTPPGAASAELSKSALDIYAAYQNCTKEEVPNTRDLLDFFEGEWSSAKKSCLLRNLESKYPNTLRGFDLRYRPGVLPNGCVQCLGFVALSISLVSGSQNSLDSGDAASHYNDPAIVSGGVNYRRFSPTQTEPIKEGDIGIAPANPGREGIGGAGHALIVKSVDPDAPGQFTGVESSFPNICFLNQTWKQHFTETYHFFRKV